MKQWRKWLLGGLLSCSVLTGGAESLLPKDKADAYHTLTPEKLKQLQQWREIRLQQAIANGDVSAEEAAKIRQRWQQQAELMDKWQKGTLTPAERARVEKSLEKRRKRWERREQYHQNLPDDASHGHPNRPHHQDKEGVLPPLTI